MAINYVKKAFEVLRSKVLLAFKKAAKLVPDGYISTLLTNRNVLINRVIYTAPPAPYRRLNMEARDIAMWNKNFDGPKSEGFGKIKGGEWDSSKSIRDHNLIWGLIQRFDKDMNWTDTRYYQKLNRSLEIEDFNNYDDIESYLDERCIKYDKLFYSIKSCGYEPKHDAPRVAPHQNQFNSQFEVLVTIGRDGTIALFDGFHRFAIAYALRLEIPVQVACRHKQWQELRDEIHKNGLPDEHEDLRDHPDLQDVLN